MSRLVSLSQVKAYLGKAPAKTIDDPFIISLIEEYSNRFEQECGQPIAQATTVHEWTGNGRTIMTLPHRQVVSITSLEYLDGMDWRAVPSNSYVLARSQIHSREPFRPGVLYRTSIIVGHDPDKIPGDVIVAVRGRVVVEYYDAPSGKDRFGITSEKEDAGTDSEARTLTYDRSKSLAEWAAAVRRHGRLP